MGAGVGGWVTGSWGPLETSLLPQSLLLLSPPPTPPFSLLFLSHSHFYSSFEFWNVPGGVLSPCISSLLKVFSRHPVPPLPLLSEVSFPFSLRLLSRPMSPASSSTRKYKGRTSVRGASCLPKVGLAAAGPLCGAGLGLSMGLGAWLFWGLPFPHLLSSPLLPFPTLAPNRSRKARRHRPQPAQMLLYRHASSFQDAG